MFASLDEYCCKYIGETGTCWLPTIYVASYFFAFMLSAARASGLIMGLMP